MYAINSHSQSPVSVEVPVQGLFPLKSIWRCRISALQVPEHAPQLSHVVHAPSSVNYSKRDQCHPFNQPM